LERVVQKPMISLCFRIIYGPIFSKSETKGSVALKKIGIQWRRWWWWWWWWWWWFLKFLACFLLPGVLL